MKFSIVHFEKPSNGSSTGSSSNTSSNVNSSSLKQNNSFTGGRKSPTGKLVMTRRTEILEPMKQLDDLKQIQLSLIQQRLANNSQSRKSPTTTNSTESVPSIICKQPTIAQPYKKVVSIPQQLHKVIPSPQKPITTNSSLISHQIPLHQHAIILQKHHQAIPLQTSHMDVPATLNVPIVYLHHANVQIPHNNRSILSNKYPPAHQQISVNNQPQPKPCTVSGYERVLPIERPQAPMMNQTSLTHHVKFQKHVELNTPQYSKQLISKPLKMVERKKRLSISFNELLNDDHEYTSSH